ncbi:MAG: hypothetical protein EON89_13930 [Brevundimonas sp.]|nr:MAG: hypothetical protein EON89_13930 [Brevundimonas sp.]
MALCLAAGEALACTVIIPPPRPGETLVQAAIRMERREQRRLRTEASHVYLARVVEEQDGRFFQPVLAIDGSSPPRRVSAANQTNCEPSEAAAGELRIVFARRLGPADMPWRPWKWGEGALLGSRRPGEVVDRDLAAALRRAAAND